MSQTIKRMLDKQPVRYLISGGLTALTEYGSFVIFIYFDMNILLANALSFIASLFVGFTLNRQWVFKSNGNRKKQISAYLALSYINLGIGTALIWIFADILAILPLAAKIMSMLLIACSNYFIFSKLLFRLRKDAK